MFASLGLCLRQYSQFLTLPFLLKDSFFDKELIINIEEFTLMPTHKLL